MRNLTALDWVAYVLVVVGAINWGLIGLTNYNLVSAIFGFLPTLLRLVYILVGLAGLYLLYVLAIRKA